jgi:hypothetical protein
MTMFRPPKGSSLTGTKQNYKKNTNKTKTHTQTHNLKTFETRKKLSC